MMRLSVPLFVVALMFQIGLAQVVRVPARVEVSAENLVLADIAQIHPPSAELANIAIGYSPYPGHYRWLDRSDLENCLRKHGVQLSGVRIEMQDRVLLTRQTQSVGQEQVRKVVEDFLAERHPELRFQIEDIEMPGDILLPEGDLLIQLDHGSSITSLSPLSLKLDFMVEGRRARSQWVRVKAAAFARLVTASRDIEFGREIQPSDLQVAERQLDRLGEHFLEVEPLLGTAAKRAFRAGEPIRRNEVRPPTLVKRGDVVTVLTKGRNFSISTLGRAREAGTMGDQVLVDNLDSKQPVRGVVTGGKQVEVELPGGTR
jgi:flagella basal body P-ring formation protein FlgA